MSCCWSPVWASMSVMLTCTACCVMKTDSLQTLHRGVRWERLRLSALGHRSCETGLRWYVPPS